MSTVPAVRGPVDADDLGTVLMHEHVFVLSDELRRNYPHLWDPDAGVADAIERLRALKARGVDTIVDPTVLGLGRDVELVARVNAEVDLHIVPATGLYTYDSVPFAFGLRGPGTMPRRPITAPGSRSRCTPRPRTARVSSPRTCSPGRGST